MAHIITDLKETFKKGNTAIQLIFINVGVFLVVSIANVIMTLFGHSFEPIVNWISLPAWLDRLLIQPWSIITYMFLHVDILHILFNMLWLYWFGLLFLNHFSSKHLRGLYLFGGICGGIVYILAYNIFPYFAAVRDLSVLMGASASVMAIVIAATYRDPNYQIRLLLFGSVRLKYLAILFILSDLLFLTNNNAGGHFAHLGGVLGGFLFAYCLKHGTDLTKWINWVLDGIVSIFNFKPRPRKPKMKVEYGSDRQKDYQYNKQKKVSNEEIDRILEKIKRSGYSSLSEDEKKKLFDASQR